MSDKPPIDLKHDRRQWLKGSAAVLGSSLLPASAIASKMESKIAAESSKDKAAETKPSGRFLTPREHRLVAEMAETIIPADSKSGGAKAANVVDYIEEQLRERASQARQSDFTEGLRLVDLMSQHYCGKSFIAASSEERIAVFTVISTNIEMTDLPEVRFFKDLRQMTINGYYSSKIGIHDDQGYKGNVALMEYVGCDDPPTKST
jgi:glucoside 3-dehydrogenase (cytochrome c) hitch-hiker subunit